MSQQTIPCIPPTEVPRVGSFFCIQVPTISVVRKICPLRKACFFVAIQVEKPKDVFF